MLDVKEKCFLEISFYVHFELKVWFDQNFSTSRYDENRIKTKYDKAINTYFAW